MSRRHQRLLGDRELQVLAIVAAFRVVDGGQLQRLVFPDGTVVGARRRTQACLKRLVEERYLARLQRRVGGVRAGSASYCYCLASRGQRTLHPDIGRPRRMNEPGLAFVAHHLAVTDVYVGLVEAERAGDLEILDHQTEPACWRRLPRASGGSDWLKPDLYVAVGVGEFELGWFIEVDLATESLRRVERSCDRYAAYYRSGIEQARSGVFPRVAWLASTPRRAAAIEGVIAGRTDSGLFVAGMLGDSTYIVKGGDYARQQTA